MKKLLTITLILALTLTSCGNKTIEEVNSTATSEPVTSQTSSEEISSERNLDLSIDEDFATVCINDLKSKYADEFMDGIIDNTFCRVVDTLIYDIDGDGIDECLVLYNIIGYAIDCYKNLGNEVKSLCMPINNMAHFFYQDHRLVGQYAPEIYNYSIQPEFYDKINVYNYNNGDTKYPVLCFYDSSYLGRYNFIVKIDMANDKFNITPMFYWGVDKVYTNQGHTYPPVYKRIDENGNEIDISPEELQKHLDNVEGIDLNCMTDYFYRIDKDDGLTKMTSEELDEFMKQYAPEWKG